MDPNQQIDPEMMQAVQMEAVKVKLMETLSKLTGTCWDQCMEKTKDKLDYKQEDCIKNCVNRYLDTAKEIEEKYNKKLQGGLS